MIKVTTRNGTHYIIDQERGIAKRVRGEGRNEMRGDGEWFDFLSVTSFDRDNDSWYDPIEVGKPMYFVLTGPRDYDWRMSTTVVSIEEVE